MRFKNGDNRNKSPYKKNGKYPTIDISHNGIPYWKILSVTTTMLKFRLLNPLLNLSTNSDKTGKSRPP
jgi:hypothetical protein